VVFDLLGLSRRKESRIAASWWRPGPIRKDA
jgi:hypothetical protein